MKQTKNFGKRLALSIALILCIVTVLSVLPVFAAESQVPAATVNGTPYYDIYEAIAAAEDQDATLIIWQDQNVELDPYTTVKVDKNGYEFVATTHSGYLCRSVENRDGTVTVFSYLGQGEKIKKMNVAVGESLTMRFYFSDLGTVEDGAYFEVTMPDKNGNAITKKVAKSAFKADGDLYYFTVDVPAAQLTQSISFRIVNEVNGAKQYGRIRQYCFKDYADQIIDMSLDAANKENETIQNSAKAIKTALDYGASSQEHFGHNTDDMANKGLYEGDTPVSDTKFDTSVFDSVDSVKKLGDTVVICSADTTIQAYLESGTALQFAFKVKEGVTPTATVKVDKAAPVDVGVEAGETADGYTYWYVTVSNISAARLNSSMLVTMTAVDSDVEYTATCEASVLSWAKLAFEKGSTTQQNLAKAIYNYFVAMRRFLGDDFTKGCAHTTTHTEITLAPTCTTKGNTAVVCSKCGETISTSEGAIAALGHVSVTRSGAAATCTTDGWTSYKACAVCNAELSQKSVIPATGNHTVDAWTESVDGATAVKTGTCTVCNKTVISVLTYADKLTAITLNGEALTGTSGKYDAGAVEVTSLTFTADNGVSYAYSVDGGAKVDATGDDGTYTVDVSAYEGNPVTVTLYAKVSDGKYAQIAIINNVGKKSIENSFAGFFGPEDIIADGTNSSFGGTTGTAEQGSWNQVTQSINADGNWYAVVKEGQTVPADVGKYVQKMFDGDVVGRYFIVKIRASKNISGHIYANTIVNNTTPTGYGTTAEINFSYTNAGDWQILIYDFDTLKIRNGVDPFVVGDSVKILRFDIIDTKMTEGEWVEIAYIALTDDLATANAAITAAEGDFSAYCNHTVLSTPTDNGNGTHSYNCLLCGKGYTTAHEYSETAEWNHIKGCYEHVCDCGVTKALDEGFQFKVAGTALKSVETTEKYQVVETADGIRINSVATAETGKVATGEKYASFDCVGLTTRYLVVKYRSNTTHSLQIYANTYNSGWSVDGKEAAFSYAFVGDGQWHIVVLDMDAILEKGDTYTTADPFDSTETIKKFRVDLINAWEMAVGAYVEYDYVAVDNDIERVAEIVGSDDSNAICTHVSGKYVLVQNDDGTAKVFSDDTSHFNKCAICGEHLNVVAHTVDTSVELVPNGDGTHTATCADCGAAYSAACTESGELVYNETTHSYDALCECGSVATSDKTNFLVKVEAKDNGGSQNLSKTTGDDPDGTTYTRYTATTAAGSSQVYVHVYQGGEAVTGQYVAIRYRVDSTTSTQFTAFTATLGNGDGANGHGDSLGSIGSIVDDGEWHVFVYDLSEKGVTKYTVDENGDYRTRFIRLGWNSVQTGGAATADDKSDDTYTVLDIDYIAFADNLDAIYAGIPELCPHTDAEYVCGEGTHSMLCPLCGTETESVACTEDTFVYNPETRRYNAVCVCGNVVTANKTHFLEYKGASDIKKYGSASYVVTDDGAFHYLRIKMGTSDSTDMFWNAYDNPDNTSETGQYFILKYRLPDAVEAAEGVNKVANANTGITIFTSTTANGAVGSAGQNFWIATTNDGEWHTVIVDLAAKATAVTEENGVYSINFMRFGFSGEKAGHNVIDLAYMGFANEIDALYAYDNAACAHTVGSDYVWSETRGCYVKSCPCGTVSESKPFLVTVGADAIKTGDSAGSSYVVKADAEGNTDGFAYLKVMGGAADNGDYYFRGYNPNNGSTVTGQYFIMKYRTTTKTSGTLWSSTLHNQAAGDQYTQAYINDGEWHVLVVNFAEKKPTVFTPNADGEYAAWYVRLGFGSVTAGTHLMDIAYMGFSDDVSKVAAALQANGDNKICTHEAYVYTQNNDGLTHNLTCAACGTPAEENVTHAYAEIGVWSDEAQAYINSCACGVSRENKVSFVVEGQMLLDNAATANSSQCGGSAAKVNTYYPATEDECEYVHLQSAGTQLAFYVFGGLGNSTGVGRYMAVKIRTTANTNVQVYTATDAGWASGSGDIGHYNFKLTANEWNVVIIDLAAIGSHHDGKSGTRFVRFDLGDINAGDFAYFAFGNSIEDIAAQVAEDDLVTICNHNFTTDEFVWNEEKGTYEITCHICGGSPVFPLNVQFKGTAIDKATDAAVLETATEYGYKYYVDETIAAAGTTVELMPGYIGSTNPCHGRYLVIKYRADFAGAEHLLDVYANTVKAGLIAKSHTDKVYVKGDGNWYVTVLDLATLINYADPNGTYADSYTETDTVKYLRLDVWNYWTPVAGQYIEYAYIGLSSDIKHVNAMVYELCNTEAAKATCRHKSSQLILKTDAEGNVVYGSDGENHWNYCAACNEKINVTAHTAGYTYNKETGMYEASCSACNVRMASEDKTLRIYKDNVTANGNSMTKKEGRQDAGDGFTYTRYTYNYSSGNNPDCFFYAYAGNASTVTGKYFIMKYRFAEESTQTSIGGYMGTANFGTSAAGTADTMKNIPVTADGEWHIMVVDLTEYAKEGSFYVDDNGDYCVGYIRFTLHEHYLADGTTPGWFDVAYVGFDESLERIYNAIPELCPHNDTVLEYNEKGNFIAEYCCNCQALVGVSIAQPTVTVTTDKASYAAGETVNMTLSVQYDPNGFLVMPIAPTVNGAAVEYAVSSIADGLTYTAGTTCLIEATVPYLAQDRGVSEAFITFSFTVPEGTAAGDCTISFAVTSGEVIVGGNGAATEYVVVPVTVTIAE